VHGVFSVSSVAWLWSWVTCVMCATHAAQSLDAERTMTPPNPEQLAYDLHDILLYEWYTPILSAGADSDKQVEAEDLPPLM
jgi:hypothetical protein